MKKLTSALYFALCACLLPACYRTDIDGQPVECPASCDDGIACTDDYCGADGECHHFDHCLPPAECLSALDCEDGNECTVDYCDEGFCTAREICDGYCGDVRVLSPAVPAANFSVATDGERVLIAWQDSREFGGAGRYTHFPLLDPPVDAFSGELIEAESEVRHPISVWPEAETPKVFWTHDNGSTASMMMADYNPDTGSMGEAIALTIADPTTTVQSRLNDVVYHDSGEFGLAFDGMRSAETDPGAYFARMSGTGEVLFWQQIGPARSMQTRIAATVEGYSLAYTAKPYDDGMGEIYEMSYDFVGFGAPIMLGSGSHFDTLALASIASQNIVFYDQMLTEDVNQLLMSWSADTGVATMDLDFMVRGVDTLVMTGEDTVLASWCNVDFATGQGALRVVRVGPGLLSSLTWIALPNGCVQSQLLRAGDDSFVFWLDEPGERLSYRRICE